MYNKNNIFFIVFVLFAFKSNAQDCFISVKGQVLDEVSETPLPYVNVFIQEISEGAMSDENGNFSFDNICEGHYHFIFSHIGCEDKMFHYDIEKDTFIQIKLYHTPHSLGTVVVAGKNININNEPIVSVNRQTIEDNTNQNISALLENETGVHLLKNGNGISKPVVHGLYGNRITILNNGILQSGQQWGNDHSPEIDPFASDKITILKGVNALEYGGNLGSVILSEPKRIQREPHLHGQVNYIFETNGLGQTLNARLGKYSPKLAWSVTGSLKKYGDKKSADYYLNNTGLEEGNLSLQLEKSWNDKWFYDFYASTFNTKLGVLRGSHIGNLTDLEQALINDVPFYTESNFSYKIDAPKQHVSHHLIKNKLKYFIDEDQVIEIVLAGQINDRKEFDIRRNDRSDIPALSLLQYSFNSELKYSKNIGEYWKWKLGNQNVITDNPNNPETGILPLIPDYITWKSGLFSTFSRRKNKTLVNFGIRYDYENQTVLTISNSLPREIIRYENQFHNFSGMFSFKTDIANKQSLSWNTGYAMRNPAVNELYSNGLHQGVSGIEEGDVNLKIEKAVKNTLEYKWIPNAKFNFNALLYHQYFNNYIFLNPQDEIRLTIRGAFPVFKYEQTNAQIYGLDLSTQVTITQSLIGKLNYSFIKGRDLKNESPLIFIPPNSLNGSLTYRLQKALKLSDKAKMDNSEIELLNRLVLKQNDILEDQDFLAPPPAYYLLGLKISTNLILPHYKIRCFIKGDNLLNTKYRDYLNRQRYFADDLGWSVSVGVNVKF